MNWKDIVSNIIQILVFIFSSVSLTVGVIKGDSNIGKLIFYAWVALTTQQNIFYKISLNEKERN